MYNQAFSKIWIIIILITFIIGGILGYQYWWIPKVEKMSKPYIHLNFPNGGEIWKEGETYNITWGAENIEKVDIVLLTDLSDYEYSIATDVEASRGSYSWVIPEFWKVVLGHEVFVQANKYKIWVGNCKLPTGEPIDWESFAEKIGEECNFDESDNYFTIIE